MHIMQHNQVQNKILIAKEKKVQHCSCYNDAKVWWEACEMAALVLPSSGTSERVFSMLSNMFGDKQASLLSDALKLGLMLAFNKREA